MFSSKRRIMAIFLSFALVISLSFNVVWAVGDDGTGAPGDGNPVVTDGSGDVCGTDEARGNGGTDGNGETGGTDVAGGSDNGGDQGSGSGDDYDNKTDISTLEIVIDASTFTYNGEEQHPTISAILDDGTALTEGVDYNVEFPESVEPGSYNGTVTGLDAYSGEASIDYEITKITQTVTGTTSYSCSKDDGSFDLDAATDGEGGLVYKTSDSNVLIVSSTGTVMIRGEGQAEVTVYARETDYYSQSENLVITVTVGKNVPTITGTDSYKKTVLDGSFVLHTATNSDGQLVYSSSDNTVATVNQTGTVKILKAGTTVISVYAKGTDNFEQSATKKITVTISKAKQTVKVSNAKNYTLRIDHVPFMIKASTNGDGRLRFKSSNTKVAVVDSTGKVTIKGVGATTLSAYASASNKYATSNVVTFNLTVVPKGVALSSLSNSANNAFAVKWRKGSGITGYVIQFSAKSDFSAARLKVVSSASTVSTSLTNLTKGYKYYVRIRTYKTVGGKNYYSSWSSAKYLKVTKGVVKYISAPKTINVSSDSDNFQNTVTWSAVSGATGYQSYYSIGSGSWTALKSGNIRKVVQNVKHGKWYYYRVRAYQNCADGSRRYSKWTSSIGDIIFYNPNFTTYVPTIYDESSVFGLLINNNGNCTMRVYSSGAMVRNIGYSVYTSRMTLVNPDNDFAKLKYVDIPAGESVTLWFLTTDNSSWSDDSTRLYYRFFYDGITYSAVSSNTGTSYSMD